MNGLRFSMLYPNFLSRLSIALLVWLASNGLSNDLKGQEQVIVLQAGVAVDVAIQEQQPAETAATPAAPTSPRLRLKNNDFVDGELISLDSSDSLGWKSAHFLSPLEIPVAAIRGFELSQKADATHSVEPWTIEMHSGDRVLGDIKSWKDGNVVMASSVFGEIQIPAIAIGRILRNSSDIQWTFQGPRDPEVWKPFSGDAPWTMQGGSLVSSQIGSRTIGKVQLPEKAAIDLRLSWEGKPGLVIALGVDENASNINNSFRIETWQSQLVLVRQAQGKAEIVELETIDANQSVLELTVYFDQKEERVVVYSGYGKQLADLKLASSEAKVQPSIALANHTENMRLDRLRVREWTMQLPADRATNANYIIKTNGEAVTANVVSGSASDGWQLKSPADEISIPWNEISEVIQMTDKVSETADSTAANTAADAPKESPTKPAANQGNKRDDEFADLFQSIQQGEDVLATEAPATASDRKPKADKPKGPVDSVQLEFFDGSRWRGKWNSMAGGIVEFTPDSTANALKFPLTQIMSLRGTLASWTPPTQGTGRKGAFMGDSVQLEGVLVAASSADGVMAWHAAAAKQAATIKIDSNARLDFRGRARRLQSVSDSKVVAQEVLGFAQVDGSEQKPVEPPFQLKQLMVPSITLRNGDTFAAQLQSVNEEGILFKSEKLESNSLKNEAVQSIELRKLRASKVPSAKKVERLLTVPRSAKNDPPTHVLISVEGDFLRGRLVAINADFATMEIRLEQVQVPLEKVAQIVWLHERSWKVGGESTAAAEPPAEAKPAEAKPQDATVAQDATGAQDVTASDKPAAAKPEAVLLAPGSVVAMFKNGLKMSFKPTSVDDLAMKGVNELLGNCNLAIADLDMILLGPNANAHAADLAANPWKLTLAKSPMEPDDAESGSVGEQSSLVGQPAPEIELETATGEKFQLSKLKGKIVVLDFWASWCGPCMQTMPEVDKIVGEFPADKVKLFAVNLEEPAERAKSAMERLKLQTEIVLDIDGVAAQRYQANAIPQTVIIDRNGKVLNVFVGGGQQFLQNFREALEKAINDVSGDIQ